MGHAGWPAQGYGNVAAYNTRSAWSPLFQQQGMQPLSHGNYLPTAEHNCFLQCHHHGPWWKGKVPRGHLCLFTRYLDLQSLVWIVTSFVAAPVLILPKRSSVLLPHTSVTQLLKLSSRTFILFRSILCMLKVLKGMDDHERMGSVRCYGLISIRDRAQVLYVYLNIKAVTVCIELCESCTSELLCN